MILALQGPYSSPSSGSASVSPSKRSGSASTSPTVHPARSGSSNCSSISGRSMPSHCRRTTCLAAASGEAFARDQLFGLPLDERGLRLRFLGCQSLAFSGLKLVKSRLLDNRQRRTRRQCVQHHAGNADRAAACLVLLQRRLQDRPALEYKARRLTDHAVDKRTVEQGAAAADHEPAQTLEPAAVVQRAKKSLDVGTVLDHRDRHGRRPSPAIASPVSLRDRPALVELRVSRATPSRTGSTVSSAGQKPP